MRRDLAAANASLHHTELGSDECPRSAASEDPNHVTPRTVRRVTFSRLLLLLARCCCVTRHVISHSPASSGVRCSELVRCSSPLCVCVCVWLDPILTTSFICTHLVCGQPGKSLRSSPTSGPDPQRLTKRTTTSESRQRQQSRAESSRAVCG